MDSSLSNKKAAAAAAADAKYGFNAESLQNLRTSVPWMQDPKFFKKVALSPSAIMKIMMHCQSGVEKGIRKGGNPVEVMGMLVGRPDPEMPETLIVTDAFPLPIEGFETRVVADDEQVVNHMIALGESLEKTRHERFSGWYHSHPFDLGDHSHCFLSQTDLSTQLQWQRAEDPHGNPFVAIVVDPLRSVHLQKPEIKAFRAYPPEYSPPHQFECPDGSIMGGDAGTSSSGASGSAGSGGGTGGANSSSSSAGGGGTDFQTQRLERWGSCWNRYYELQTEYFMSSTSRDILERLTQDYLWMRTLSLRTSTSTRKDQLSAVNKQFHTASTTSASGAPIVSTVRSSSIGSVTGAAVRSTSGGSVTGAAVRSSSSGSVTGADITAAAATARGGGSSAATRSGEGSGSYSQVRAEQGFAAMAVGGGGAGAGGGPKRSSSISGGGGGAAAATNPRTVELHKAVDQLATVALEEMCEQTLQRAKTQVFGSM